MAKKKILFFIILLFFIGITIYFLLNNISINKSNSDSFLNYTPEQEISDEQSRETSIILYFLEKNSDKLKSIGKNVDAKELLKNPYKIIVQKLLEGPNSDSLEFAFPDNTRLIDANFSNNCVTLNFSKEFLNFKDDTQKYNMINCILNSLTQLTEVNSIKILINNETNNKLDEEYSVIS